MWLHDCLYTSLEQLLLVIHNSQTINGHKSYEKLSLYVKNEPAGLPNMFRGKVDIFLPVKHENLLK